VQVVDESHKHRGHAGAAGGGGHFRVTIASPRFAGLSLVQAQRLVYEALGEMMTHEIHALTIHHPLYKVEKGDGPPPWTG